LPRTYAARVSPSFILIYHQFNRLCGISIDFRIPHHRRRTRRPVAARQERKSPHTIRAYGDDVAAFRRFIGKPLRATYLSDRQRYADSLVGAPATRGRRLKRMGYLPFNAGAAIHGPALEQKLAERILSERQVFALLEAVEDRAARPRLDPPPL
jgi:hypothetical protein